MERIIDLTHALSDGLAGFPGNEIVRIKPLHRIEEGGYKVSTFFMDGHTGTHLDVPSHVFQDGESLEKIDLNKCIGSAFLVSLNKSKGEEITRKELEPFTDKIKKSRRLIIATGWSKNFGTPEFYKDYPGISPDAATWMTGMGIVLLGVEQPSVHPARGLEVHHKFLSSGVVIVEALTSLEKITKREFKIICLPLLIQDGDGSPSRVVAVVD